MKKIVVTSITVLGLTLLSYGQTNYLLKSKQVPSEFLPVGCDYKMEVVKEKITVTSDSTSMLQKNDEPFKQPEVIKIMKAVKKD